jgi:AcrR family transcriptional regulator
MRPTSSPQRRFAVDPARSRLLSVAIEVFAERGFHNTGVAHILAAPPLNSHDFDAHFAGTEDCFLQAYDAVVGEATEKIVAAASIERCWPERLAAGLGALFDLFDEQPSAARLVFVEAPFAGEAAHARFLATVKRSAVFMRGGRAYAGPEWVVPPVVDTALPAGVAYMLRFHLTREPEESLARLYAEGLRLLLLPYLGESATANVAAAAQAAYATRGTGCPS